MTPVRRAEGHRLRKLDRRAGGGDDAVRFRRRRDQDRAARRRRSLARLARRSRDGQVDYYWQLTSRNKRSLALDLKHAGGTGGAAPAGRVGADVFITNFPLPVRDRLQMAPADLLPLNPRLIYASFTAYGEDGEEAAKTGFDSTAYWARTGLMDMVRADADTVAVAVDAGHGRPSERHRRCMPRSSRRCTGGRRPGRAGWCDRRCCRTGFGRMAAPCRPGCSASTCRCGPGATSRPMRWPTITGPATAAGSSWRCYNEQRQLPFVSVGDRTRGPDG